jgi:hypothetical protein
MKDSSGSPGSTCGLTAISNMDRERPSERLSPKQLEPSTNWTDDVEGIGSPRARIRTAECLPAIRPSVRTIEVFKRDQPSGDSAPRPAGPL